MASTEWHRERRRNRLRMAKDRLGGKCRQCAAIEKLNFHHRDSKQKRFDIQRGQGYSLPVFLAEVDKCDLLCRECHREAHGPNWNNPTTEIPTPHWALDDEEYDDLMSSRKRLPTFSPQGGTP